MSSEELIGPSLHADDVAPSSGIGPAIPLHLFKAKLAERSDEPYCDQPIFSEGLATIGPLPPGLELHDELRHYKPDSGVRETTINQNTVSQKRDAWMTQLLPISGNPITLKPRKFQMSTAPSGSADPTWFTTPSDSVHDQPQTAMTLTSLEDRERESDVVYNEKMAKIISICQDDKRKLSLLELHEKKLQRKEKKKEKKARKEKHKSKKNHKKHRDRSPSPKEAPTRIPFDRDRDLKVSSMDAAARQALVQRSKQLASRFAHGSKQFL